MVWAPGAKPADYSSGPDTVTTTFSSAVDAAARTRRLTITTGVGTPAAASTTTVLDLVTGEQVRSIDGVGRVTSYAYDASGRRTRTTTPAGLRHDDGVYAPPPARHRPPAPTRVPTAESS